MADSLPPELIRRGWAMEVDRLQRNLARELDEVELALTAARAALAKGQADTNSLRRLYTAAGDASRYGAALAQAEKLRFALPDATTET